MDWIHHHTAYHSHHPAAAAAVRAAARAVSSPGSSGALAYRHQMGIAPDSVLMAVVVQLMVPSEVSGILFENPRETGPRFAEVPERKFGLGECRRDIVVARRQAGGLTVPCDRLYGFAQLVKDNGPAAPGIDVVGV